MEFQGCCYPKMEVIVCEVEMSASTALGLQNANIFEITFFQIIARSQRQEHVMSSSSRRPTASPPQTPPRSIAQLPNTTSPLSPISPWPPLPPPLTSQPPSTLTSTTSIHTFSSDPLPTAKEAYGSLTVLLTYLTFLTYLLWSLLPTRWLETFGWSWFPDQYVSFPLSPSLTALI